MRCGPTYTDPFRGSTAVVYRILLETKPGYIPIEQPTNFCTNIRSRLQSRSASRGSKNQAKLLGSPMTRSLVWIVAGHTWLPTATSHFRK